MNSSTSPDATLLGQIADDYAQRRQRGEPVSIAEYAGRYPQLAEALHQILPLLDVLQPAHRQATVDYESVNDRTITGSTSLPTEIPGYEILRELGRGGMGVVLQARQLAANRIVALKMILSGPLSDGPQRDRFRTEVQAIARLQHPNIVQIFEVGEHQGQPFFSMEFCEGGSLDRRLRENPLPGKQAAELIAQLAEAMAVAHRKNVIHRDLKPANILLTQANHPDTAQLIPRITDFGLAKKIDDESGLTQTHAIMGTPSYMAPEQAMGETRQVGPAADIYALGAILYECLTGRPPFRGATVLETLDQVRNQEPVPPRQLNRAIPRDLETICLKCLRKSATQRYVSADDLADDLRRYLAGKPITARPVGAAERLARWCRRNPAVATLVGTAAFLLLAGVAISWVLTDWALREANDARTAQNAAQTQGRIAGEQREKAQLEAAIATRERRQAQVMGHALRNELIVREREKNNWSRMQQLLDSVPADFASAFETQYLRTLWKRYAAPMRTLSGHKSIVSTVAWSPNGKLIATAGAADQTAILWDVVSEEQKFVLAGHTGRIEGLAFSPDGSRLATCGGTQRRPGEVKIWDTATGQEQLSLPGHPQPVLRVSFSPDGQRILTGSDTGRIWDLNGKLLLTLKGHTKPTASVAWSPDGKRVATGSGDMAPIYQQADIKLWDATTGNEILALRGHTGMIVGLCFMPRGDELISAGVDGTARLWDVIQARQRRLCTFSDLDIRCLAVLPDSTQAVVGGQKRGGGPATPGEIRIWDLNSGSELLALLTPNGFVYGLALSPDGRHILSGHYNKQVHLWDAGTGLATHVLFGHGMLPTTEIRFSPNGQHLLTTGDALRIWDSRGILEQTLKGNDQILHSADFSPDGKTVFAVGTLGKATFWDLTTGKEARTLQTNGNALYQARFSPDGKRVVAGGADRLARIWDAHSGTLIHTLSGHKERIHSVAYSPDGTMIATAGDDQAVFLWDTETGRPIRVLTGHSQGVTSVVFSPNGKQLATTTNGRRNRGQLVPSEVRIWAVETGRVVHDLRGHLVPLTGCSFTPDGTRLATGGAQSPRAPRQEGLAGELKIWDTETGLAVLSLIDPTIDITSLQFSPDGRTLAVGGGRNPSRGTARLYSTFSTAP